MGMGLEFSVNSLICPFSSSKKSMPTNRPRRTEHGVDPKREGREKFKAKKKVPLRGIEPRSARIWN